MIVGVGEAPGKIVLIGEHAVVYGHPAIAIPVRSVSAHAEVVFTREAIIELEAPDLEAQVRSDGSLPRKLAPLVKLAKAVMVFFDEQDQGLKVTLRSTIPVGRGMGSGAAVSVAIVRGICDVLKRRLNAEQIAKLALVAEKEYHGTPSGVDTAVVARNEPIYFVKGKPARSIDIGPSAFHFLIADTGVAAATVEVVDAVCVAREKDQARYDAYFWEMGSLASVSREILRTGSPVELGLCMNRAHRALVSVGVSCEDIEQLVRVAMEHGALGAKLSGAGRGGAVLVLLKGPEDEERIAAELVSAGAENIYGTVLSRN